MFVTNCDPGQPPNPGCCSNPRVLCPKCATSAITNGQHGASAPTKPTHEPLGIPVLNFRKPTADKPKQKPDYQRGPGVVTNGKPTHVPLGIPVMRFLRKV